MDNPLDFIELANICKIPGAYDIYKHCMYRPTQKKFCEMVAAWEADRGIRQYGCFGKGQLLGIAIISFEGCRKMEIVGISVAEYARGIGIGSFMIDNLKKIWNGFEIYAETDVEAVGFYRNNGFEISEVAKVYGYNKVIRYCCTLK